MDRIWRLQATRPIPLTSGGVTAQATLPDGRRLCLSVVSPACVFSSDGRPLGRRFVRCLRLVTRRYLPRRSR